MLPPIDETRRQWAERLRADVPELQVAIAESAADLPSQIAEADAAFGWVPPDTLPTATKLRWLQNPDAGPFIGYYYDALVEHPVVVCNPRGVYSDHIAHHILMFILALSRGLPDWISAQRQRQWDRGARQSPYVDIASSTVLINGMGGIGQETARLLYNMGASIVGVDPRPASDSEFEIIDPSAIGCTSFRCGFCCDDRTAYASDRRHVASSAISVDEVVRLLHQHRSRQDRRTG